MKKLFVLLALVGVMFSSISCNMVRGAGRDVEKAGDAVQDAVR